MTDKVKEMLGSIPTTYVLQIGIGLFVLGQIYGQFQEMIKDDATTHETLTEIEKNKASNDDLESVDNRLNKYIERFNKHVEAQVKENKELHKEINDVKCKGK